MDYIYVAVLILVLFNAKKSAECDNGDIISMAGCNISLTWILPNTKKDLLVFNIGSSYEKKIATLSEDQNCQVRNNSSMICSLNSSDDGLIVVLKMFNITAWQSDNYTLWKQGLLLEQSSEISKKLVVIGKPTIMEIWKPIVGMPFQMTCSTTYEHEHYKYIWRINDIERTTAYNLNSLNMSSLRMIDNFSNVTCRVCFNEAATNLSCVTCEDDGCSMDSDPYTIQVLYGPDNVSLSREERHFYLKEYDIFAIDCFANCYPSCIFWWKGRNSIESQTLNIIFESRMAGQYVCHVTNQQTNITLISDPITLQHVKEDHEYEEENLGGIRPEQFWMATVIVSVLLLINGLLMLVIIWRRNTTRTIDSRTLSQACVRETHSEASQTELETHIQPLHILSTKVRACKRNIRLECPNDSPEDNCRPNPQEDHYNDIDEDGLSAEELGIGILIPERSEETGRNTGQTLYDYAYSIATCHAETANLNVADETNLTTCSDFARMVDTFPDKVNDKRGTDHAYLTVIDDLVNSI